MSDALAFDLGPEPPRPPRPRPTPPAPMVAAPTLLVPSGAWERRVETVRAPLLNDPAHQDAPTLPASAPQSAVEAPTRPPVANGPRDRTARGVLAVLVAFGPGCQVIQTTTGIRERVGVLVHDVDSSGHS